MSYTTKIRLLYTILQNFAYIFFLLPGDEFSKIYRQTLMIQLVQVQLFSTIVQILNHSHMLTNSEEKKCYYLLRQQYPLLKKKSRVTSGHANGNDAAMPTS